MTYQEWINARAGGYGQCAEATMEMVAAFPELRRVRGHYYDTAWGERSHWWCVTAGGQIVDPTAAQFPSRGHGVYDPWVEGEEEPTGKCMNCGAYCYQERPACSDACQRELESYYGPRLAQ